MHHRSDRVLLLCYNTERIPGLLQKMSKKCNSPGIFRSLVVFKAYFFENLQKFRLKRFLDLLYQVILLQNGNLKFSKKKVEVIMPKVDRPKYMPKIYNLLSNNNDHIVVIL